MAMQFRAATRIKHGMGDQGDKIFEVGDVVSGLDKETMSSLWEAGALRSEEVQAPAPATKAAAEGATTSPAA